MSVADWERIEELFGAALSLDAPGREAFLKARPPRQVQVAAKLSF